MRIAMDIEPYFRNRAGVGRYIGELLPAMTRLDDNDRYTLFRTKTHANDGVFPRVDPAKTEERVLAGPHRMLMLKWLLFDRPAIEDAIGDHDVYWGPQLPTFSTRGKLVVTIHDLVWRKLPGMFPRHTLWTRRWGYRRALKHMPGIIAVSEATRRDILEAYDVPPERVRAVHNGIAEAFRRQATDDEVRATLDGLGLRQPYILSVAGDNSPKKNLVRLVRSLAELAKEFDELTLACVGKPRYRIRELEQEVTRLGVAQRVRFLGRVSDESLRSLYAGAELTAYPSLYEGFGFPVVESMSQGTPVVTSNVSSLPEVAGDAALLADPEDVDDLADAMRRLMTDRELRDELSKKGLLWAKDFTWERTARQTRDFLAELCGG